MRKPFDVRVVCLLVLAACLGPGAAREAAAQAGKLATRDSVACSLGSLRTISACARFLDAFWMGFANRTLSALDLEPDPRDSRLARDGVFVHPNAPSLYELARSVKQPAGNASGCGQFQYTGEKLAALMCRATKELRPYRWNQWGDEKKQLNDLRQRLADAQCLPRTPEDPCDLPQVRTIVARAPAAGSEEPIAAEAPVVLALAEQGPPEPRIDLQ